MGGGGYSRGPLQFHVTPQMGLYGEMCNSLQHVRFAKLKIRQRGNVHSQIHQIKYCLQCFLERKLNLWRFQEIYHSKID